MGTSKRYKDKQAQIPAPNKYQIPSTVNFYLIHKSLEDLLILLVESIIKDRQ